MFVLFEARLITPRFGFTHTKSRLSGRFGVSSRNHCPPDRERFGDSQRNLPGSLDLPSLCDRPQGRSGSLGNSSGGSCEAGPAHAGFWGPHSCFGFLPADQNGSARTHRCGGHGGALRLGLGGDFRCGSGGCEDFGHAIGWLSPRFGGGPGSSGNHCRVDVSEKIKNLGRRLGGGLS